MKRETEDEIETESTETAMHQHHLNQQNQLKKKARLNDKINSAQKITITTIDDQVNSAPTTTTTINDQAESINSTISNEQTDNYSNNYNQSFDFVSNFLGEEGYSAKPTLNEIVYEEEDTVPFFN